jgi:hypothetical protein
MGSRNTTDIIGNNVARLFQAAECGLESPRHINSFISDKVQRLNEHQL